MPAVEKLISLHKSLLVLSHGEGFIDYPRISKLKHIIQSCAEQLNVSRVSVWKLDTDAQRIVCEVLYLHETDQYYQGAALYQTDFPKYFRAIAEDRLINADNAITDSRTKEFADSYLIPNDICSMLDAPIFSSGKLQGVICLEQVGEKRVWDMPEMSYVASLADHISMINEHELWLRDRAQLEFLEQYDPLTGLEKRNQFQKRLDFNQQESGESGNPKALLLIGLDSFASINDQYGHMVADHLLVAFARRLEKLTRQIDCRLARVGGDTFGIWIPNLEDTEQLNSLTHELKLTSRTPLKICNEEFVNVSSSTGVVIYPIEGEPVTSPMRCAELAMRRAKESTRGGVQYFAKDWLVQLQSKRTFEHDLVEAIEQSLLVPFYQPIYCAQQEKIMGLEALVRWPHPEKGYISPAEFLPTAKKLGLMERLGSLMLRKACEDLVTFEQHGKSVDWVSVNIASEQLHNSALSEEIASLLQEHDLPACKIELEIVEELIGQNSAFVRSQLEALSSLGVRMAIDDFGTGYSSLSRLKHMPVTKLKIDKSFVDGLPDADNDRCIANSIVGLAKGLQMELVAEGVELLEQADYLKQMGCEYLQGYYFAKPMSKDEILKLL
ncbi:EAL domain-containing protein [Neptuniibacter sp. QD37_11]|uniref:sensor domain-containing phosphodiesterase n=1 Tax=Neptuniibacter sp. QD37_11 TaxID=3398209 RepID=UPI0039F47622